MQHRIYAPLLAILLTIVSVAAALAAPPPLPSSFFGTVTLNGANLPDGTLVSAWIGGAKVAEARSRTVAGASSYVIDVPGVDVATEGAAVSFQVSGYAADQGAVWHSGAVTALDLTAAPPPVAPVASNAEVSTAEDTPVAVTLSAFDANNDPLTYIVVTSPAHGTLSGAAPNLLYTPELDYNGADSFTFKANDGSQDSNLATVSIAIAPVPDEPVAQNQGLVTDEDTSVVFTLQASDPNGDPLTFVLVTSPTHGTLSGAPPGLIYDPVPDYNGSDSFTFKVNDGRFDSNIATVAITVRALPDAPQIPQVPDQAMDEGQILNITIPSGDPDGTTPTLTTANLPAFATFSQSSGTATLRFEPDFTEAGTYPSITVTVADGTLSASTVFTLTVDDVAPTPQAEFSTSKGLNVAAYLDGASIAAFSSIFSTAGSHLATNAIDTNIGSYWHTANTQPNNQWIKVALTGNTLHVVDRVVLRGTNSTNSLKDFQLRVSTTGFADGDFTTVFTGTVPRENNFYTFTFPPVQARYVQLFVTNNWGASNYTIVAGLEVYTRDRAGGIVSMSHGPLPTLTSFTSQYDTGHRVEYALDDDPISRWASGNGQRTNQSLVVQLAGGQSYAIDRVRVQPRFDCCFDQRVKDFEVWVSADNVTYSQVLAATAVDNGNLQEFVFPSGAVNARYVKYVALNNRGSGCCVSTATFQVITTSGYNVARLGGVGGAIADFSSVWSGESYYQPTEAIDFDLNTDWDTGNGQNTNQWLTVRLIPGAPFLVDRVRIRGVGGTSSPKDFLIQVSTTGTNNADFTTVFSGQLPNDGADHWYSFAPTAARFVRFYILNNYGHINIRVYDFQVYSPQLGEETVPFDDFSTNPFAPIVAWNWDFGDGNTSSVRHPLHTFAAPGTYSVTLTVTNSDSVTDTATLPYTVLQRPAANFTWTPPTPDEGQNINFTDGSTDVDGSLVGWLWKFTYTTSQPATQNTTANFPDNGDYPVVLAVTDSQLLTSVITRTISVNNLPPTVDIGPNTIVRRSGEAVRIPGDETFRNWNDASSVDRNAMQFLWDAGDGRTFTSQTVNYSYPTPGVYTVRLTLTDPQGATATDTMQVTVYDDASAPTTAVAITGSQNVALPETMNLPSMLSMGASVHSFSSQYDTTHRPENLLDLHSGYAPWASANGQRTNQWAIIRLAGDQVHTIDRVRIQPRADCCFDNRPKDFEVWVSATGVEPADFTRVLSATAADSGALQEYVLPGGPVAARFVKYVALNNRGSTCCISTTSFHVVSTDPLGPGGVVAVSSQFDAASGPELLLDDHPDSVWRTANGQNSNGWVKLLLSGGQTWPIHGLTLQTAATNEAVKEFELWVSTTGADDADFTRVITGVTAYTANPQHFFFPEVAAKYVKVVAINNHAGSCCLRIGTIQVRASVPAQADGWYNTNVVVSITATDNAGGSGVAKIESSSDGSNWSTYTGPFLFSTAGSNPIWGRATDVARNLGAPDRRHVAIDKSPRLTRYEAGQAGVDWLSTAVVNKSTKVLQCVACHVQGDTLHGLAVSTASGYRVDTAADSELTALINFLTAPTYHRAADGLWVHPPPNGNDFLTMNTSHSLFGLAMYDRNVSTDKTDSLLRGVQGMLPRQQANGRWALDHSLPPTNQGDILPTTHMIFALQQAKTRVDGTTAAGYQSALDRAVAWLRTAALSIYAQDKSMKLLGLLEAGAPRTDGDVVSLRTQILNDQLADGGWREDTNRTWSSVFATGQSLYALCRAGVSRFDPQVVKGIDWLIHTQASHSSDTLVPRYLQDGAWLLQYTGAGAPFVSTMWAVIALGCFGELGLDFNIAPAAQQITPNVAETQTVTFSVALANTGAEDDTYDLAVSGGLPGWSAVLSLNPVALAVSEGTAVDLVITAPANQPENLVTLYSVTATSRKNPAVTRAASVSVNTSAVPTGGHTTLTRLSAGNGITGPVDYPIRLAAVVTDTVDNVLVVGPNSGVVNFLVAGIAVGSDTDADGDGVYEILWTPGAAWTRLGSQDLRALYSGVDRADPQPDLQSSFAAGNLTLNSAVRPVADDQTLTTNKNTPLVITLTASDPNGDLLTYSVATSPTHGTLSGSAPTLTYTPYSGFVGEDSFTFTASDGANESLPAVVSISVISVNDAPILDDIDDATMDEGATLSVTVSAMDPDGDALILFAAGLPAFATFTDNGDGTGEFAFAPGYADAGIYASIIVTATDDELSASAGFTLTVRNVNRAPVASDQVIVTDEDMPLAVTLTAADADGDALTYTLVTTPTHGTLSGSAPALLYTPAANYHGPDAFTFRANDGSEDSNVATVAIGVNPINDAPAAGDDTTTTDEDTPVTLAVLTNDSDLDGDSLSISALGAPANGVAAVSDSSFAAVYTPTLNFYGVDVFTYTVSDGTGGSATATVTVTVNAVNDAPAFADVAVATLDEGAAMDEGATLSVTVSAVDPDAGALTLFATALPAFATFTDNGDGTGAFAFAPGYADAGLYAGITVTATDGELSASANFTLTVRNVNRIPAADDQALVTNEDTPRAITLTAADADGDAVTFSLVTSPTHGTLSGSAPALLYTPAPDFHGVDTLTFRANDGSADSNVATVTLTINPVNDAPVAGGDTATTNEDTPVTIAVLTNDSDVDGDSLSLAALGAPAHGVAAVSDLSSAVVYTPTPDFSGEDVFTYTVSDGKGGNATGVVTVLVNSVNDAPSLGELADVMMDEGATLSVAVLALDPDADVLTLSVTGLPAFASFTDHHNGTGEIAFAPGFADAGLYAAISVIATDGELSASASFTLTVRNVNRAPVAADQALVTDEDTPLAITLTAADADGDAVTFSLVTSPTHGTLSGSAPALLYTPAPDFHGVDTLTFRANDGSADSNVATVTLTINPVNDAPAAVDDTATTDEDTPVTLAVLANDSDLDGDSLSIAAVGTPAHGVAVLSDTVGTVTYTPDPGFSGVDAFSYTVSDGKGSNATAVVTVLVNPVNDAPGVGDLADTTMDEGATLSVAVSALDPDADVMTLSVTGLPTFASFTDHHNGTGEIAFAPGFADAGTYAAITVTATDGELSASASFALTVRNVNRAPFAADQTLATAEDTPLAITLAAVDADGDALTFSLVTAPTHGALSGSAPDLLYTPAPGYSGLDALTFRANDGSAASNVATVALTINSVNDAPSLADLADFTMDEGATLNIAVSAVDPDADALTLSAAGLPAFASFTDHHNGAGALAFTPGYANAGAYAGITVTATDGELSASASFTLTVRNLNRAPVAADQTLITNEDTPLALTLTAVDADGEPLTFSLVTAPTHGALSGSAPDLLYTPAANYHGPDTFTFRARDGSANSNVATVALTVNPVNDAPAAVNETAATNESTPVTIAVLTNDSDVDGDSLSLAALGTPAHGVAAVSGSASAVVYTPNSGFSGADVFTYTVSDGKGGSATATVTVTVNQSSLVACNLYPIALHAGSLVGVNPGDTLADIFNGGGPGNFGWLSWTGSPSTPTLIASLTPPGDSYRYTNPNDGSDHVISAGDWVRGSPGVSNAKGVRDALDRLKTLDIVVPVWDTTTGQGNNAKYRVTAFATVRILDYRLPGQNRISVRYAGMVRCGAAQTSVGAATQSWDASPSVIDESLWVEENAVYLPLIGGSRQGEAAAKESSSPADPGQAMAAVLYLPVVTREE